MPTIDLDDESRLYDEGLVPLIVGVTGHRDLVAGEVPQIRKLLMAFFNSLRERFPDRPLTVISPLAEGADRLVAEVALQQHLKLIVPMPMPRDLYLQDFATDESRHSFEQLCASADSVYELPVVPGSTAEGIREPGAERNRQYAQLGVFLCAHSHILLALWDGKPADDVGGTAQVVRFHHDDSMAGYVAAETVHKQLLVDDESDLVYHIVVSRNRDGGQPHEGLDALSCSWLTANELTPRTTELPVSYVRTFERTSLFNAEARQHRHQIERECYPLIDADNASDLPQETHTIDRLFCAADWLAINFQQKMLATYRITHSLAFIMGLLFIFYSDFEARRGFMLVFFACFVLAFLVQRNASRRDWYSKHLEYRALAEGLRVQFYWAAAGVTSETISKFSHDNFLQKQDAGLGWIRNVMRVAGIGCDVAPNLDRRGLDFVIKEWIGDQSTGGQLKYYDSKTRQFRERSRQLAILGQLVSIAVSVILVAVVIVSSDDIRNRLFVFLGTILLVLSIRQAYAYRIAEKELIKQYEFMQSIFANARRRMRSATSDLERRRILRVLGESALDEHAEWIFLRRERPPDPEGLWRMET